MAKIDVQTVTTVSNTYTLTLTEFEAQCLFTLIGSMTGTGKANAALASVWTALNSAKVGNAPMSVSDKPAMMYVTDTE